MFAEEIRRQAECAPRAALLAVAGVLWKAFAAGAVTEAEAEELSRLIEARKALAGAERAPVSAQTVVGGIQQVEAALPRRTGSRPQSDASMERRRRWAAAGRLPPQLAARFTLAEVAVLAVVAAETVKRGDCRLCHGHIAALAGVARSTVRATLRRARELGAITIEERRASAWRNLANVVRIASREWQAWNRLVRRPQGGGDIFAAPTSTQNLTMDRQRSAEASRRAAGGQGRVRATVSSDSQAGPRRPASSMR